MIRPLIYFNACFPVSAYIRFRMQKSKFRESLVLIRVTRGGVEMKCNVGGMDMAARLIGGAILLGVGFAIPVSTIWQVIVFAVAAIALVTGIVRYCPANALLGFNSCVKQSQVSQQSGSGAKEPHGQAK
jgi:hypothetical protein